MMTDESQETILASDSSSSSDHVVLSSSAIQEAQHHQLLMPNDNVTFQQHHHNYNYTNYTNNNINNDSGQMMQLLGQRPSSIVRQWFDDMKSRASQIMLTAPTSPGATATAAAADQHEDEYYLVPDSGTAGNSFLDHDDDHDDRDDHDNIGDVSMVVDIYSDPFVELMLENRIAKLETDLEACEIDYQKRIQNLYMELQQQSFARVKERSEYQSAIDGLQAKILLKETQHDAASVAKGLLSTTRITPPPLQQQQQQQQLKAQIMASPSEQEDDEASHNLDGIIQGLEKLNMDLQREADDLRAANGGAQSRVQELEAQVATLQREQHETFLQNTAAAAAAAVVVSNEKNTHAEPEHTVEMPRDKSGAEIVEKLSGDQIVRYSRQLLLQDGFGVEGQTKLLSSSVLVVGAGGIGSTVLMYLAASGIGHISIVDFDQVDMSNLHRQVIHTEANIGVNKAVSACQAVKALNPTIRCTPIQEVLTFDNAHNIVASHDCVVDASDNPRTRYLINDACVLAKKPLVSGSAMGTEGQLTVYNHKDGPCYRCLYPKPNATEGCKTCSDNGVLGPVPGLIGILQALEVIKLLTGVGTTMHDRLLMYDALRCTFVNIKKPSKSKKCPVCSDDASIHSMEDSKAVTDIARGPTGVVEGSKKVYHHVPSSISEDLIISCADYNKIRHDGDSHILLDVRAKQQFDMCSLEGAVNIPLADLKNQLDRLEQLSDGTKPIYCLCRRGIFSIQAAQLISEAMEEHKWIHSVKNISGGLAAWSNEVDISFPQY